MTKQDAIDLIKLRLGSRDDTDLDALIVAELVASQDELEGTVPFPWFCLTENASRVTVVNESRVPVPDDFVIETDDMLFELSTDGGLTYTVELVKADYDALRAKFGDTPAQPQGYALVGPYFILSPTPDAVYSLRLRYQGRDTLISALAVGETNKWLTQASDYLVNHAGITIAASIKDVDALGVFTAKFDRAHNRMIILDTAREEANRERHRGDE